MEEEKIVTKIVAEKEMIAVEIVVEEILAKSIAEDGDEIVEQGGPLLSSARRSSAQHSSVLSSSSSARRSLVSSSFSSTLRSSTFFSSSSSLFPSSSSVSSSSYLIIEYVASTEMNQVLDSDPNHCYAIIVEAAWKGIEGIFDDTEMGWVSMV